MENYEHYRNADFGDKRLGVRMEKMLGQLAADPTASILGACKDPYQAKAVYRFVNNDVVTTEEITRITREVTIMNIEAAKPSVLLIPEDTTELNYSNLKATEGLGSIGGSKTLSGIRSAGRLKYSTGL